MILKKFLLILVLFFTTLCQTATVATNDKIYQELNQSTGVVWGFTDEHVRFSVSDEKIAEVFKNKDGDLRIRFNRAGDVYVRATFYDDKNVEQDSLLYLIHVTGNAVDDSAVNKDTFAVEVLRLVNEERRDAGLKPLRLSKELCRYASIRARECIQVFSHTRPNGKSGLEIIPRGTYRMTGENLAGGQTSPEDVVKAWMDSPGHRENIMQPKFSELGVGYIFQKDSQYRHYWVQLFRY